MTLAHAADVAHAMGPAPGGGGGAGDFLSLLPLFAGMFLIMYFVMIRPQQKQRQERERMLSAVKKGDRVVTTSGLHGTVIALTEHTVTVRAGDQVKLEFDRASIGRIVEVTGDRDG